MVDRQQTRRRVLQAAGIAIGSSIVMGTASAGHDETWTFHADLTGEAETQDVETNASGRATFEIPPDQHEIHYTVDVERLCDVTQAHIHLGGEGEDGPVVAWLYPEEGQEPQLIEGRFDGTLAEGTLSVDDLVGPLEGADAEEIVSALIEEDAYVNVHTETYPAGEIRGQIRPDADTEAAIEAARDGADSEEAEASEEEEPEEEEPEEEEPGEEEPEEGEEEENVTVGEALEVADRQTDVGHDTDREYILFENTSDQEIDLSGYVVTDRPEEGTAITATFPDGFTLGPGEQVRVTSGDGEPTNDEIFMGSGRAVWREQGDVVVVEDPDGNVVFEYEYGDQVSSLRGFFGRVRTSFV